MCILNALDVRLKWTYPKKCTVRTPSAIFCKISCLDPRICRTPRACRTVSTTSTIFCDFFLNKCQSNVPVKHTFQKHLLGKTNVTQTYATHVLYAISLRLLLTNYYVNFDLDLAKRTNRTIFN